MKLVHWSILIVAVGIVYVLVKRPTVPAGGIAPSTSNDLLGTLFKLGGSVISKIGAPSGTTSTPYVNAGTYDVNSSTVTGNTLVDDSSGQQLTYGTD
jgi:hypothetical protein